MENKYKNLTEMQPDEISCLFQEYIKDTFHASLGMQLLICEQGHCLTRTPLLPMYTNATGVAHGGFLFTIADTTAGLASVHMGSDSTVTTVDSHIQYFRPGIGIDTVYAEAEIVKDGKRLAFVDVKVFTEEGVVLAKGSFTFARITLPHVKTPQKNNPCK